MEKSTFFKELTPHLRTYELHNQGGKKCTKSRQTNTSHCPTKTVSKTDMHPLKKKEKKKRKVMTSIKQIAKIIGLMTRFISVRNKT